MASTSGDELVPPGPGAEDALPPALKRLTLNWSLAVAGGGHSRAGVTPTTLLTPADEVSGVVVVFVVVAVLRVVMELLLE